MQSRIREEYLSSVTRRLTILKSMSILAEEFLHPIQGLEGFETNWEDHLLLVDIEKLTHQVKEKLTSLSESIKPKLQNPPSNPLDRFVSEKVTGNPEDKAAVVYSEMPVPMSLPLSPPPIGTPFSVRLASVLPSSTLWAPVGGELPPIGHAGDLVRDQPQLGK